MALTDTPAESRAPLHSRQLSKDCGAMLDDERRAAVPVGDDDFTADDCDEERVDDDKSVAVLTRDELEALDADSDAQLLERLTVAIRDLREQDDWLVQHEATTTLRRVVVHHTHALDTDHIDAFLGHVVRGCANLRSALSKNSLLALAECFECLDAALAQQCVAHNALLDVLLRRAACEKQFLREAAAFAVQQLTTHVASWQLITRAGAYAKSKNGRLCATAARVVAASLRQLQSERCGAVARIFELDDGAHMRTICQALAVFSSAKDKRARLEAAAALKVLGDELGASRFESVVKSSLKDSLAAARIIKDVFPPPVDVAAAHNKARRGSLRERMLLDTAT